MYIRASHILLSSRKRKERSRVSSRISDCRANFYLAIKIWRTNDNGSEKFLRISCRIEFRSFSLFFHLPFPIRIEKFRRSEDGNLSNKHGASVLRAWLLASQLLPTSIYLFPHYPIIQFRGGPLPCLPSSSSPQHKQKPLVSFFTALSVYLLVTMSRGATWNNEEGGRERKKEETTTIRVYDVSRNSIRTQIRSCFSPRDFRG